MNFDKPTNDIIRDSIETNLQTDGWAQLAKVGATLKIKGVKYGKLSIFFQQYSEIIEIKSDDSVFPPVAYVKMKEVVLKSTKPITTPNHQIVIIKPVENKINPIENVSPRDALKNWAWLSKEDKPVEMEQIKFKKWLFNNFQKTIAELKDFALEERWHYHVQDKTNPYPILVNYLAYTFYRLTKEKDKILYADNYATFNTGLVDKRYEPIFGLFVKTKSFNQPFRLVDFCVAGEDYAGKTLVKNFSSVPARAHYFNNISDMLYDTLAPKPQMDLKHILIENIERLPTPFLEEYAPKSFEFRDVTKMNYLEKTSFFESLGKAIENDSKSERNFTNRLKDSLELSLKRVQWNFKTAIPQYFPTMNTMSVLLPLCLVDDEKVDVALVAEKTKSGNYLGHTILPLEWAYGNARLVSRPDSDWLIAEKITPSSSIEKVDFG